MECIVILRYWFKCEACDCCWYDDNGNEFTGCPECGGNFDIFDVEDVTGYYK